MVSISFAFEKEFKARSKPAGFSEIQEKEETTHFCDIAFAKHANRTSQFLMAQNNYF